MKTEDLRQLVAETATKYAWIFVEDEATVKPKLAKTAAWKREQKAHLRTFLLEIDDEPDCARFLACHGDEFGFEYGDVLKPNAATTDDCIARHFVHDEFDDSLDCLVVTTPDDAEIIGLFWHSD